MSMTRFAAIDTIQNRLDQGADYLEPNEKISSYYGSHVFGDDAMKAYLKEDVYLKVKATIQNGQKLDKSLAQDIADAMKVWAMEKGATHYAHWFQPLTGKTAEKHDSFFNLDLGTGKAIEEFPGSALAQQEPDGSSFPGGGLRSTFEARGYTAWDPSSPAFILEVGEGRTLCIPTIFVTYSGQTLDYKLPFLRSISYLEKAALDVVNYFEKDAKRVTTTLGWEQEYFLVDEALFNARPDLVMCGRTLIGKHSVKGQQLDDHYFGSIPERVYMYMRDLEIECHKLGIPVRTRHNEVGPGQYELAPMFEEANVAIDHNQLLMDLMDRIARRHKLRVLLHEKPFDGVNGSGKHNNWSMATDTGTNLLKPGKEPGKNLQFLTFFVNTIKAVSMHAPLLRASVASASNDHRLGANEAPPAIVSVFIGEYLTGVLDAIEAGDTESSADVKRVKDLLKVVPNLEQDNTDRNRTSPFAFTGNKFEIRMVGSTANCAAPMTIMNAIVGKQLVEFKVSVDALVNGGQDEQAAILSVIKQYISESKAIRFEGDNYSQAWADEAAERGLENSPNTPRALDAYVYDSSVELFTSTNIFTNEEIHAHHEVMLENYILKLNIECRTLSEMCMTGVMPAVVDYMNALAENVNSLEKLGINASAQKDILSRISEHLNSMKSNIESMLDASEKADAMHHRDSAIAYCENVKPYMEKIRNNCDSLESMTDDREWPFIKYREMMFVR